MKPIIIVGAGGFGREVEYLIETINEDSPTWEILGYVDDNLLPGTKVGNSTVIGNIDSLYTFSEETSLVIAIGSATSRKKIYERLRGIGKYSFPNLIDPRVKISNRVKLGNGNIICAGCLMTVDIVLGDFVILNLGCTVGHDVNIESFVTVYPSVNISGYCKIGEITEIGAGVQIIQGLSVASNCIIGAGAVVVKNLLRQTVYIGIPAKGKD